MTRVKICGVTSGVDALGAAEAGVDAIGLNFWSGSPRFIFEEQAREIVRDLPPDILRVGVFVDPQAEDMEELAARVGLDVLQVHGVVDRAPRWRWWQAVSAGAEGWQGVVKASEAEMILLDTPAGEQRGGSGRVFDWALAKQAGRPVVLAGGLSEENVGEAIRQVRPWGVDACSRLESAPGRKDHGKMRAFVRAVRESER